MMSELFVDDDLVALRREQRRRLASVPGWVLERLIVDRAEPVGDHPVVAVDIELRLREAAQATADAEPLAEYLARSRRNASARSSRDFLSSRSAAANLDLSPFSDLARAWAEEDQATDVSNLPQEISRLITRLVQLLVWADDLAGDYADPRLPTTS